MKNRKPILIDPYMLYKVHEVCYRFHILEGIINGGGRALLGGGMEGSIVPIYTLILVLFRVRIYEFALIGPPHIKYAIESINLGGELLSSRSGQN